MSPDKDKLALELKSQPKTCWYDKDFPALLRRKLLLECVTGETSQHKNHCTISYWVVVYKGEKAKEKRPAASVEAADTILMLLLQQLRTLQTLFHGTLASTYNKCKADPTTATYTESKGTIDKKRCH